MKFHRDVLLAPLRADVLFVTNKGHWFTGFAMGSVEAGTWSVMSSVGAQQFKAHELQGWAVLPEPKYAD